MIKMLEMHHEDENIVKNESHHEDENIVKNESMREIGGDSHRKTEWIERIL